MRLSFPNPEPRLKKLLSLVTECSKWGLFTRPLTENWGRSRIQLIGDAAHAMLPNAGQGACQAFEDAYILARWLEAGRNPVEAFAKFRRVRIPRVHAVQRLSLANARFKHMRDSAQQKDMVASGKGSVHGSSEWVWAYDPPSVWDQDAIVPAIYADAGSAAPA
jgi:salicylate hydroxylase